MKKNQKHIIIFSHGFGVLKDDRGLFTELSKGFLQDKIESVMFDYNEIDYDKKEITVKPFSEQAKILQKVINETVKDNPDSIIDIITHSQGAVMVALAKLEGIRSVIILAPFFYTDIHNIMERYTKNSSNEINFSGTSKRLRSDGTTTIIPASYWTERFATDIYKLYNDLALTTDLTIINAGEDEIMDKRDLSKIFNAKIINIHGNHDFSGESRKNLVSFVEDIIIK
ncbi:MAG: hypothetical protein PHZ07_02020 [Patescibacteria group bacterium]|nr:hypothetical protein [Patescibacteria group bacterium]MDD4304038.1 hypothetical protein [Patescibacteria group bacterium]MDD4694915.1 hypothetical protein [Patescibacteria group bacterium]